MIKEPHEEHEVFVNLIPMIDILTALLFFLLLGYKSQSTMLEEAKGLTLPASSSEKALEVTVSVVISLKELKVQDSHVMFLKNGTIPDSELSGNKIVPLYNRILRFVKLANDPKKKSAVLILADKRLKTDVITKVMKTVGMAGLPNFHFGVAKP